MTPEFIKSIRQALSMTEEEFAFELGISAVELRHYENGTMKVQGLTHVIHRMDELADKAKRLYEGMGDGTIFSQR